MITIDNYFERTSGVDFEQLPEALAKGHTLVSGAAQNNWEHYHKVDTIKRVVNAYFEKLDSYLKSQAPSQKSKSAVPEQTVKPTRERKTSPERAVKPAKAAKQPKGATSKKAAQKSAKTDDKKNYKADYKMVPVEILDTDVQFIRRYTQMDGKVKTQAQVLTLIHSLQKAILERRIRKTSPYAAEIKTMQEQLIKLYEKMGETALVRIAPDNLKRYQQIAHAQTPMPSAALLKAYISLNGRRGVEERIQKLMERMKKAVGAGKVTRDDKYSEPLQAAYKTMAEHLKNKTKVLHIHHAELSGIKTLLKGKAGSKGAQKKSLYQSGGTSGAHENPPHQPEVISSAALLGMAFETIGLQGKYRQLIGDLSLPPKTGQIIKR